LTRKPFSIAVPEPGQARRSGYHRGYNPRPIAHPAYNRGPVTVASVHIHAEF